MTYILFSIACDCVLWYTTSFVIAFYFFCCVKTWFCYPGESSFLKITFALFIHVYIS